MTPLTPPPAGEITLLLARSRSGDEAATARLGELIYSEFRAIAGRLMAKERIGHTLQPTEIVHMAWERMESGEPIEASDRRHYCAIAARVMRNLLVDHARAKQRAKNNRGQPSLPLRDHDRPVQDPLEDVIDVSDAMDRLELLHPRQAKVAEMKYFCGCANDEIASVLGVSRRTVEGDWTMAKATLLRLLGPRPL